MFNLKIMLLILEKKRFRPCPNISKKKCDGAFVLHATCSKVFQANNVCE